MGLLERLRATLPGDRTESTDATTGPGVEYQCSSCGTVFDTAREACPHCGETEIRERGSFEFRPQ